MAFTAANSVPCIKCHDTIAKGEPISWTRGKGAQPGVYHVACPSHEPIAVTFLKPAAASEPTMEPETDTLPVLADDYNDDMPEPEPDPEPGTRAWFSDATMDDREFQIALGAQECTTQREFTKLVKVYSRRASDRECMRLRRFARGVWAGLTVRAPEYAETEQMELALFPEPATGESDHGRMTQTWRELIPALAMMPS